MDDPAWRWLYPPNGWGCNCLVDQIGDDQLRMNKWKVGTAPKPPLSDFTTATGDIIQVPEGIAPGFGYNPGTAHLQVIAERAFASVEQAISVGLIDAAKIITRELVDDAAFIQFIALPKSVLPIGILDDTAAAALKVDRQLIRLSEETQSKQLSRAAKGDSARTDIALLRGLPDLFDQYEYASQEASGDVIKLAIKQPSGNYLTAVIKRTVSGKALFATSIKSLSASQTRSFLLSRNANILRGNIDEL